MILGIDASNIRAGGGLTHLCEIMNNIEINNTGFDQMVLWARISTLDKIKNRPWLIKKSPWLINSSSLTTLFWQIFFVADSANRKDCDLIFVPGSTFLSGFRPFVTLSQNMLPFEKKEALRYKSWSGRMKNLALYITQSYTFKKTKGLIFLTNYAKTVISSKVNISDKKTVIIPHGINLSFLHEPRKQKSILEYNETDPMHLLYVSIVDVYKHQWNVVEAVGQLKEMGYPVVLDLIGPKTKECDLRLQKSIDKVDPQGNFIHYLGQVNHDELSKYYKNSDIFVFASSCENLPIILIEAMTAGLPIASSNRGPMPEVLKDNGVYFDPENIDSIFNSLKGFIENKELRENCAFEAFKEVKNYTWKDCSEKTFRYLYDVAISGKK